MSSRLLNGKERVNVWEKYCNEHPNPELISEGDFRYVNRLLEAQKDLTAEIVLKEVGEWLDSKEETYTSLYNHISLGFHILQKDVESLKQGKVPE